METLILISFLGIFSYLNILAHKNFKGSSGTFKSLLYIVGYAGYWSYWAFLIWSFFVFAWWQVLLVFILVPFAGGIVAAFFDATVFGKFLSLVGTPVFFVLSLICMLSASGAGHRNVQKAEPEYNDSAAVETVGDYTVVETVETVYVCTSKTAKTYHCDPDCRGLNNCSGTILKVDKREAIERGRRECQICY